MARRPHPGRLSACLLAAVAWDSLAGGRAETFRQSLLGLARERIDVFYKDEDSLDKPRQKDGVTWRLSKQDKACGNRGTPIAFVEFDIEGEGNATVRPVDVFNVIADGANQSQWDNDTISMKLLGDMKQQKARGYAGVFPGPSWLMSTRREAYEWQVADANFSAEEFWVVLSSLRNEPLFQLKSRESGTVLMQNCLAAYRITKTKTGVHVVVSQQRNFETGIISPREVANHGWEASVGWATACRGVAKEQAGRNWNATRTILPKWMLEERPCGFEAPSADLKELYLANAARELNRSETERGSFQSDTLKSGEALQVWQRTAPCSTGSSPNESVPVWQASFRVKHATPVEVFNVLVNKMSEPKWNSLLKRVNETGFDQGARSLHEEYAYPILPSPRELWGWQVAGHKLSNDSEINHTYVVAAASAPSPFTESFSWKDTTAEQCLAVYQVSPAAGGGSLVNMSSHLNLKVFGSAILNKIFYKSGMHMIKQFAEALTTASQNLAQLRTTSSWSIVDGGALRLLAPPPPGRNETELVSTVLSASNFSLRAFGSLDLPLLLDSSAWPDSLTEAHAAEILSLFQRVEANATAEEAALFHGDPATDAIAVQLQGEALAAIQARVLKDLAAKDCAADLPPINGDKPGGGLTYAEIIGICAAVVVCGLTAGTWGLCKWRRYWRERRSAISAASLLGGGSRGVAQWVVRTTAAPSVKETGSASMGDGIAATLPG